MLLIEKSTKQICYAVDFRRARPNVSFPKELTDEVLSSYGYAVLRQENLPEPTETQNIRPSEPYEENGKWYQGYELFDRNTSELESKIRHQRDDLLRATDFYGLSDVTMSTEMATYRQALRDITNQEGFPLSVTWPTAPQDLLDVRIFTTRCFPVSR